MSPGLREHEIEAVTDDRLLAACGEIVGSLRESAVAAKGGSVTWLTTGLKPLGPHLYEGTAGIALFLAACHSITGSAEPRELAERAIAPLRQRLARLVADPEAAQSLQLGLGGIIGLGSFLYAMLRIGQWLDDSELIAEAHALTLLVTPERISRDRQLDVVGGSAGTVLALLALDEVAPGANATGRTPVELAVECSRHLLAGRVAYEDYPRAWPPAPGSPPSTGFAHGAAGVCYALCRLHARTGLPEVLEAVEEGLAFERALYFPEQGNWRDMRTLTELHFMTTWCHGAPGIALGRLGMIDFMGEARIREEIDAGLATTALLEPARVDHLCCGNMGRADIFVEASRVLGERSYLEQARTIAATVLLQMRETGRFRLSREDPEMRELSLFRGISGIGFVLLRLLAPEKLESILLLR